MKSKDQYFRRCHVCDHVSEEAGHRVESCSSCGKPMIAFFYFDERSMPLLTDQNTREDRRWLHQSPKQNDHGKIVPILGLTVFWKEAREAKENRV